MTLFPYTTLFRSTVIMEDEIMDTHLHDIVIQSQQSGPEKSLSGRRHFKRKRIENKQARFAHLDEIASETEILTAEHRSAA